MSRLALTSTFVAVTLATCAWHQLPEASGENEQEPSVEHLEQGWSSLDAQLFYSLDQGSHLVPYEWFRALERPSHEVPLASDKHLRELGFLIQPQSFVNKDGLPVGFVKDVATDGQHWLGLTCAACHTAQIEYGGVAYRIEGGPGQSDIQTFLLELTASLQGTSGDAERFDRFAKRVLHDDDTPPARQKLRAQLDTIAPRRAAFDTRNATKHPYGFARVDAFGIILNEVLQNALQVPNQSNVKAPDAPVSYPFLWDTPQHDRVQWNGAAFNHPLHTHVIGPLARNVGEVLGVFGEVTLTAAGDGTAGYASSLRRANLFFVEELLKKLHSPKWPAAFPPIDQKLKEQGRALFKQHCVQCHDDHFQSDALLRSVKAVMTPLEEVKTDPRMVRNFADRNALTGPLEGRRKLLLFGDKFGPRAPAGEILRHVVIGVIRRDPLLPEDQSIGLLVAPNMNEGTLESMSEMNHQQVLAYKARPLNGIWATAPYLHNGSVPNMDELLKPAKDRTKLFYVGSREFDPVTVGFKSVKSPGAFEFSVTVPGNSNEGHEYGPEQPNGRGFDKEQRKQLIEYLKTL